MNGALRDLVHAARALRRTPVFAAAVVIVLTLGMTAASTAFSVVSAVLLKPLPFPDPGRVVHLAWNDDGYWGALTGARFSFWKDRTHSFDAFTSWQHFLGRVDEAGSASVADVIRVTDAFFDVVGVQPVMGRQFASKESGPGVDRVALVSHDYWSSHLGAARVAGGLSMRLEDQRYTVVGVLPERFVFPYEPNPVDIIVPLEEPSDPADAGANWPVIARLRPGVTLAQATDDVASLGPAFGQAYPQQLHDHDGGVSIVAFDTLYVGPSARTIWAVMLAAALLLVIAAANVASLFVARIHARRTETAVRAALGATEGHLLRLVLAECLLVSLGAAVFAVIATGWCVRLAVSLTPVLLPRADTAMVDWHVIVFAGSLTLVTPIIVGGLAAWLTGRRDVSLLSRPGRRTSTGRARLQPVLVGGQTMLSMFLLVGAGLLVTTWINLRQVDPGFDSSRIVAARIPVRPPAYDTGRARATFEARVIGAVRESITGAAVVAASSLPLERGINVPMSLTGSQEFAGTVEWRAVTPGYLRMLAIELTAGRHFDEGDRTGSTAVGIVNQAFAKRFFPDSTALGRGVDIGALAAPIGTMHSAARRASSALPATSGTCPFVSTRARRSTSRWPRRPTRS